MARSFYCNHCGKKVARNAKECPSCERLFGAVLCPSCGFSGDESLFSQGCPSCGYLGKSGEMPSVEERARPTKSPLFTLPPLFYVVGTSLLVIALIVLLRSL